MKPGDKAKKLVQDAVPGRASRPAGAVRLRLFDPGDPIEAVMTGTIIPTPGSIAGAKSGREHMTARERGNENVSVRVTPGSVRFSGDYEGSPFEEAVMGDLEDGGVIPLERGPNGLVYYPGDWACSAEITPL